MRLKGTPVILIVLAMAMAGCATNKQDSGSFRSVPEAEGRIVTSSAAYDGLAPTRVGFTNFASKEEYALFRSPNGQSEIAFVEVRERRLRRYALDFSLLVAKSVPKWRFNQGHEISFEPSFSVKGSFSDFWVRRYQQTSTGRSCVAFVSDWDMNSSDPDLKPTKALFGYHCVPKGSTLDNQDAEDFVKSLDIRGISVPLRIESAYVLEDRAPPEPARAEQVAQLVIAQDGQAGGVSGLPEFPMLIARPFVTGDSCVLVGC